MSQLEQHRFNFTKVHVAASGSGSRQGIPSWLIAVIRCSRATSVFSSMVHWMAEFTDAVETQAYRSYLFVYFSSIKNKKYFQNSFGIVPRGAKE